MSSQPSKELEVFDNPNPERDFVIQIDMPEFTCLCPKTGQPDFATLHLEYIADQACVELKSLKLYIVKYRNVGIFHEEVTNKILDDFKRASLPHSINVRGDFHQRGGIKTEVDCHE